MKYEWKKQEKGLYGAKTSPAVVEISKQQYIMISGKGNPNNKEFSDKVSILYSLAYAIKMEYKSLIKVNLLPIVFDDYTIYPLEAIWKEIESIEFVKSELEYTIMIRQPDFITYDLITYALEKVKKKSPIRYVDDITFDILQDGKCLEILHIGSYDDEPSSFQKMDEYAKEYNYVRCKAWHREIYLNNANRVSMSKLKTILRYKIK